MRIGITSVIETRGIHLHCHTVIVGEPFCQAFCFGQLIAEEIAESKKFSPVEGLCNFIAKKAND